MTVNSEFHSISCGNEGEEINDPSPLQKHVMFFDMNKDGVIYPWETFQGLRAIGCGILLSVFLSIFINVGSSRKTRPGKGFSPLFPIEVENISKAKHESDTGVYDKEGRFIPEKFEEIFEKHARTNKTSLTADELSSMLKENRERNDYFGWVAAYIEWKVFYILCKDKQGLLHRETIKAVFDGSLFEKMAKDHKASLKQA